MTAQTPRLLRSGLTGRVYVATAYRVGNCGSFVADTKVDVTADFEAIEAERQAEREETDHG